MKYLYSFALLIFLSCQSPNDLKKQKDISKVEEISLNLIEGDLLNSPYYYLKQNDVLYFEPNTAKVKSSGLIGNAGTFASVLSLILSFVVILGR